VCVCVCVRERTDRTDADISTVQSSGHTPVQLVAVMLY